MALTHPDTQAVLLLCATLPRKGGPDVKPLTLSEYNSLASWLGRHSRRPASLVDAREDALPEEEAGLPSADRLRALLGRGFQLAAALESWQRLGSWVISRGEDCYPERLRRHLRSAAPPLLYGAGDFSHLKRGGLAVVGSRNIDEEGLSFTRRVGEHCAEQGVQIVSGGARGVDRAAEASVLAAGRVAVAVLADHLDRAVAARENRERLREGRLTLITPYEPASGFTIAKAIGRNKLIYALAGPEQKDRQRHAQQAADDVTDIADARAPIKDRSPDVEGQIKQDRRPAGNLTGPTPQHEGDLPVIPQHLNIIERIKNQEHAAETHDRRRCSQTGISAAECQPD